MQIGELVRRAALQFRAAPCLIEGERIVTFDEFDAATDRLGSALLRLGLVPGDRVSVLLPNGVECLVAYYALAKAGLVRVGLNSRETPENHAYKIRDSGSRALLQEDSRQALDVEFSFDLEQLRAMSRDGDASICRVDRPPDAPLRLGYTGGTTGTPKAVTLTTTGELCELSAFLTDLVPDLAPGDVFLHAAPIAHASGAFFLPALVRGACASIMPKFDAAAFLELALRQRPSHTFLVPTMLALVLEQPPLPAASPFRRICYGASSIAPSLLARGEERFGRVFAQNYGQAESPMVITCLRPEDHDRAGSCGRPFTIVEVAVVDDEDRRLPPGERGEIVCRGPQTMAYYWNRPEETAHVFRNGWLHTGDVGTMDEDGFFYILDRKNDMLISGGFNVYPREVEDVLMACDGVVEVAVVGIPDEKWGERVHAVIAARDDVDARAVLRFAQERLAGYKRPKSIEVWPSLPKSGANKILRREIRDRILATSTSGASEDGLP